MGQKSGIELVLAIEIELVEKCWWWDDQVINKSVTRCYSIPVDAVYSFDLSQEEGPVRQLKLTYSWKLKFYQQIGLESEHDLEF